MGVKQLLSVHLNQNDQFSILDAVKKILYQLLFLDMNFSILQK